MQTDTTSSLLTTRQVTLLKGLAILSVLCIHFLTSLPEHVYTLAPQNFFFITLDQLNRFCVPLFVALSGYGFAVKYQGRELKTKEFLVNQAKKLLPLYLLWSGIFMLTFYFLPWRALPMSVWWQQLLWGRADYHLYFVPMIFQLYLLFPGVWWLIKRVPVWAVVAASFILQAVLFQVYGQILSGEIMTTWFRNDQLEYVFGLSWLFYFVLGIGLARTHFFNTRAAVVFKKWGWLGVGGVAALLAYTAVRAIALGTDPLYALSFTRLTVMVFAAITILWLIARQAFQTSLPKPLASSLVWLGSWSFVIYLSHTLFLRVIFGIWERTASPQDVALALFFGCIGLLGSLFLKRLL